MKTTTGLILLAALAVLMVPQQNALAQTMVGSEFTYQGQLKDGGAAANGNFDMNFALYNAASGGGQVGTQAVNSVPVSNGIFTVELDFGSSAFAGDARWLELTVEGTTLSPRQMVTATPYSTFSSNTRGIDVNSDNSFVGVGRDAPFNSEEVFGIEAPAGVNGYGGMNVNTSQLISRPFYGYYAGGTFLGRHFMDGAAGRWRVENSAGQAILTANTFTGGFSAGLSDAGFYNIWVDGNENVGIGSEGSLDFRFNVLEDGYVGIQRDTPIVSGQTGSSWFDVQTPAGNNEFGGMHVATDSETGIPYYGFAAGGTSDASMFYNGGVNMWGLDIGGQDWLIVRGDTGRVGISTSNPTALLDVNGSARVASTLTVGVSACKPGGGSWASCSDRRLKKNVEKLEGSLEKLLKVRGVTFEFKDPKSIDEFEGQRVGVIAQEVEKIFPDWIDQRPDGFKTVTYRGFEALVVEALRELRGEKDKQIESLEEENAGLLERLESLEVAVAQLASQHEATK